MTLHYVTQNDSARDLVLPPNSYFCSTQLYTAQFIMPLWLETRSQVY